MGILAIVFTIIIRKRQRSGIHHVLVLAFLNMVNPRTLPLSDDDCKNDCKDDEDKKTGCHKANEKGWKLRNLLGDDSSSWESAKRKLASRVASSRSSSVLQVLKVIRAPGPFLDPDTAFTTASTVWQGVLEKGSRVLERASSPPC